jgi:glycosyltransferase involved in cell wall biosynthesis
MSTRWVVPRADVVFLASGQGPLRASVPGVVSVLEVAGLAPSQGRSAARRRTLLGRAADDGVLVHAATQGLADVLVAEVGLHRSQVVVVHPGIEEVAAPPAPVAHNGVVVLEGTDGRRDQAICDTLRAAGTPAVLVSSSRPPLDAKCAVLASPGEGFPFGALRLLAAGVPLVAARTPTTTELLEGAAELVDPRATDDVVDSVLGFTRDDTSRSIAVAAGRTRASDFSWSRRAGDVTHLVRRAAQRR